MLRKTVKSQLTTHDTDIKTLGRYKYNSPYTKEELDLCASCYELNMKGREKLIEEVEICKV